MAKNASASKVDYINPPALHKPTDSMYSHVSRVQPGTSYRIGGQVPVDKYGATVGAGDMAAQIRCCYDMVSHALTAVGLNWEHVTHLYTFTVDIDKYLHEEQAIARQYFGETPPPSTLVEVARLVSKDWMVEVQADAVG